MKLKVINRKNENNINVEIRISTVKEYVNAVVDLYRLQKSPGVNRENHPALGIVKDTLKNLSRDKANHMVGNYEDRSRSFFRMKSFKSDQLYGISDYHWSKINKIFLILLMLVHSFYEYGDEGVLLMYK